MTSAENTPPKDLPDTASQPGGQALKTAQEQRKAIQDLCHSQRESLKEIMAAQGRFIQQKRPGTTQGLTEDQIREVLQKMVAEEVAKQIGQITEAIQKRFPM